MNKEFFKLPAVLKRAIWAALLADWEKRKPATPRIERKEQRTMLKKFETPLENVKEVAYAQHILQKLRREMEYTRRPDLVQDSIEFWRLCLICAKRGYRYTPQY